MGHRVRVEIGDSHSILLELGSSSSPGTVREFVNKLPFRVTLHVWGEEIYSSESPIRMPEEAAVSPVQRNDVAYWPAGRAVCLFYGPTPVGRKGEITPASPVNVVGTILDPDRGVLGVADGRSAVFRRCRSTPPVSRGHRRQVQTP